MDYLKALNETDEHEALEAKTASAIGASIVKTICAFANGEEDREHILLLGVKRRDQARPDSYYAVGLSDVDKLTTDLTSTCKRWLNFSVKLKIEPRKSLGKTYLVVTVRGVKPSEKPVSIIQAKKEEDRGTYIRVGASTQRCSDDEYQRLVQERGGEEYDLTLLPYSEMADISPEALVMYRKSKEKMRPSSPELQYNDEELLRSLNAIRKDKKGVFRLTITGLMLFGSQQALRRLRPAARVDYIRVPGKEWVADAEKRFESSYEIRDSLFEVIRRSLDMVLQDLPVSFVLKEGALQREEKPLIPSSVLREAIVNAVMHRNYRTQSPTQIIRYADRIEIYNTGYSLKSTETLDEGGSVPRNSHLASVLFETGFAENKGSGIRSMKKMMEEAGLKNPVFQSDRQSDAFRAIYYFQHFLTEDVLEWLKRFSDFHLNDEQVRCLVHVRNEGKIDNATYREFSHLDTNQASKALIYLRDRGILVAQGKGRHTVYLLNEKYIGTNYVMKNDVDLALSTEIIVTDISSDKMHSIPDKAHSIPDKAHSIPDKAHSIPDKAHSIPDKAQSIPDSVTAYETLPKALQDKIDSLGKRVSPDKLRDIIFALCAYQPMPVAVLEKLLRRSAKHLTREYLSPAIREGRLRYTIPESPKHPKQAYQTSEALALFGKDGVTSR